MTIRLITPPDDAQLAAIIRAALRSADLAKPGTAYFDPQLDHLSAYYAQPGRAYFVAVSDGGTVLGGGGFGEYASGVAELQKLYLTPGARGQGVGRRLLAQVEAAAKAAGYRQLYLETHHRLAAAEHLYQVSGFRALTEPLQAGPHTLMDDWRIKDL